VPTLEGRTHQRIGQELDLISHCIGPFELLHQHGHRVLVRVHRFAGAREEERHVFPSRSETPRLDVARCGFNEFIIETTIDQQLK
jgi:hypothetical protein